MSGRDTPFFVGYLAVPRALRGFLVAVAAVLVAGFGVLGLAMGLAEDDPGPGQFRFDYGQQQVTGLLELTPYPVVHVTAGTDRIPAGHTLMLSGQGKNGAIAEAAGLDGQAVTATGVILNRGDLDMLQIAGGQRGLAAASGDAAAGPPGAPGAQDLGRWRLAGEICDGKCLAGAMRPGRGLAHKACANLCLTGGIPPVFVSSQPVEGAEFLLISGPGGTELPPAAYDRVGQYIEVEGQITRHGDLLVFAIDPDTMVLP